jgi:hypothetical protein
MSHFDIGLFLICLMSGIVGYVVGFAFGRSFEARKISTALIAKGTPHE